jgi:hypothetical protein
MTPPCPLLLDACTVFELSRRGAWDLLIRARRIVVPSIVARDEAFWTERDSKILIIDLPALIAAGAIDEVDVDLSGMQKVVGQFDAVFREGLHDGEIEALAYLSAVTTPVEYCTADAAAIHAAVMLGLGEHLVSLESVLRTVGLQRSLGVEFRDEHLRRHREIGAQKLIRREGFRR